MDYTLTTSSPSPLASLSIPPPPSYCTHYTLTAHSTMVVAFAWKIIAIALAKKATVYALGRVRTLHSVCSRMCMLPGG